VVIVFNGDGVGCAWRPSCSASAKRGGALSQKSPRFKLKAARNENEAELSVWGLFAVFASVTTIPILAPLGYSCPCVPPQPGDYLRIRELLSEEFVDAASTSEGRVDKLMLCTTFFGLRKALILADLRKIRRKREGDFCRFNLEQFSDFVKHWVAHLIRPEEETRHAGDPT
jgi:hypothetical protein